MTTPTTRPNHRKRMTGKERRQQLLDIGRRLFAERGFEGTSIEEIAAQADVSKPVVYEHFGGKEGLYAVVVDREVERLLTMATAILSDAAAQEQERTGAPSVAGRPSLTKQERSGWMPPAAAPPPNDPVLGRRRHPAPGTERRELRGHRGGLVAVSGAFGWRGFACAPGVVGRRLVGAFPGIWDGVLAGAA